ncbi:MAG: flagellar basal body-associated FliL family protein [Proteobacteria bacterium]|nr:flagellar basal body-associated FliL family protein [Pseudomonadota bacterium]
MADAKDKKDKKDDKAAAKEGEAEEKDGEGQPEGEAPKKRRLSGRTLILFIALPVLLLLGGGAAAHFMGLTKSLFGGHGEEHADGKPQPPKQAVFYNLPELLVNLNSGGKRASFLKISVSLELDVAADIPRIEAVMPRIVDNFQSYLRELRVEDLRGSAGLYRLREELLARVNTAANPARVNDVLFKEMLVQ